MKRGNRPSPGGWHAVVLKSSEVTPLIGLEYGRLALEAGIPAGIVNVVTGGASVGASLVNHPAINMIAFTAERRRAHDRACRAERIIPCILELGGKSPNIVFDDANLDHAITGMIYGIFPTPVSHVLPDRESWSRNPFTMSLCRGWWKLRGRSKLARREIRRLP